MSKRGSGVLGLWVIASCSASPGAPPELAAVDGSGGDITMVSFPATAIGQSSTMTLQLHNGGDVATGAIALTVTGPFALDATGTTCSGTTLARGATCDVVVDYRPASSGTATGTLAATSDPGGTLTIPLAGIGESTVTVTKAGTGGGTVSSTPAGIACGTTCTALFPGAVTLTAVPDASSTFAGWSDPGCTGTTCTVAEAPTVRAITATFTSLPTTVYLTPSSASFGTVRIGDSTLATVQLVNPTVAATSISAATAAAPFSVFDTTCGVALAAGASCNFRVKFEPTALGAATGILDVTADGAHHTADLVGTGGSRVTVSVVGLGTVVSAPAGIACGSTCSAVFGASVALTATPDAGNTFASWSDPSCTTSTCSVAPGTSITATFATTGAPAVSVGMPSGIPGQVRIFDVTAAAQVAMCAGSCSALLTAGHTIEIAAATPSHYDGIAGACTADATVHSCQFTATGPATVTALFSKDLGERWSVLGTYMAGMQLPFRAAFDDGGHLIVFDAAEVTAFDATGTLLWTHPIAAASFVMASGGAMYIATGMNLLLVDSSGTTLATHPFTGTLQFLAPNGGLLGTDMAGTTTEWTTTGSVVRTLATGPLNGVDAMGNLYALVAMTSTATGTPTTTYTASRWTFAGVPLSAIPEVAPPNENAGGAGLLVSGNHFVGYAYGRQSHTVDPFSVEAHTTGGVLEVMDTVNRPANSGDLLGGAAPAGDSTIGAFYVPTWTSVGAGVTVVRYAQSGGTWASVRSTRLAFQVGLDPVSGMYPLAIVGGPNGELAVIGYYLGLVDRSTGVQPKSSIVQTFYP